MKHLFFTCIALLFAVQTWAELEDIKFIKAERPEDYRSIVIEPTASVDGNTISLSAPLTLNSVRVVVKDMAGYAVYTNTVTIPAKGHYSFSLDNVENGDYILEVTIGDDYFYGYFAL